MDLCDQAQIEIERQLDRVFAARVPADVKLSLSECIECGIDIPKKRQDLVPGVETCFDCQELIERGSLYVL